MGQLELEYLTKRETKKIKKLEKLLKYCPTFKDFVENATNTLTELKNENERLLKENESLKNYVNEFTKSVQDTISELEKEVNAKKADGIQILAEWLGTGEYNDDSKEA